LNLAGILPIKLRAQAAQQQISYEGEKVAFIDLVGRPDINVEALRPVILQKVGEPYCNERVQGSVAGLKHAGQFSKVDVEDFAPVVV
jgi:outer membrane protein assembly factor BamA